MRVRGRILRNIESASVLSAKLTEAMKLLNDEAERTRQRHITPGYGKSMVYGQKAAEARQYLSEHLWGQNPEVANFPFIEAEVGITGGNPLEVAEVINSKAIDWTQKATTIEQLLAQAKIDLAASGSIGEIREVVDNATIALRQI